MLIRVESVSKEFGNARKGPGIVTALDDVSLDIAPGEFVSIVGPSGCGKSTLLRLVSGLDRPTRGRILFDGAEVKGPIPSMGMAFQQPTLLPWRTVLQNVLLPFELMGQPVAQNAGRAMRIIELTGLAGFEHRYPDQLSGGMQQRVGICRSLVTEPRILLMDEPFAALDLLTREEMGVELARIAQERAVTTLFITHSISEAVFLSDRVVVMSPRPGKVIRIVPVPTPRPRPPSFEDVPAMMACIREVKDLIYQRKAR